MGSDEHLQDEPEYRTKLSDVRETGNLGNASIP